MCTVLRVSVLRESCHNVGSFPYHEVDFLEWTFCVASLRPMFVKTERA